ncbi:proton-coupled folate transporter-like [Argiope bruennichi]|uniref:proton-coupled folate transporter-like n=1 Tax=Argiope bruennichi TaxID=94029 RepID=UPI0024959FE9|nr:proton-coupled folate transporter-like [Argiope bruennichi]XP_055938697.1 proton-coupled folate transporter-like [Argiope bruennichi]XP_055938703.1 proton-coupled folate transporter-like [Argiope bruennichi]
MEKKDIENGTAEHSADTKPEKAEVNTPLKSDEGNIQYGSVNDKDPLMMASDPEVNICMRVCFCLRSLTIEPIMFLFSFAFVMNLSCLSNMMMNKGCLYKFNYSESVCNNLSNYPSEKKDVEVLANNYSMYYSLVGLIGAFMMVFIAPWSDKYGRKLPLLMAFVGTILGDIGLTLCTYNYESDLFFVVLARIPAELFGGFICILTIIYSHASEVSSRKTRTMKYTFVEISFNLGMALGGLCGGLVYRYYGYFYIYIIGFVLHVMCLPWLLLVVEETTGFNSTATWKEKVSDFFVCESLLKGWKASVRVRENNGRALILLYFASMCVIVLTYESLGSIGFIYVHHIYNWDPTTYNTINTIFSLTTMVVLGASIPILVRIFKVSDFALGLMGVFSMMAKYTFFAFAHYGVYLYYLGNATGYLNGLVPLAVRSSLSKVAERDELGKVFSFLATCEAIVPMVGTVVITKVFNATIDIFPSVSYLMIVGLLLLPLGTFLWAFICLRKSHRMQEEATSVQ